MLKDRKVEVVSTLKEDLANTPVVLLLEHNKLHFSAFDQARRQAKPGTKIKMIKNRLVKIAFKDTPYENLNTNLSGEKLLVLSSELFDACKIAKFLATNNKDRVKIIAGAARQEMYSLNQITELANVDSIQELQSRLLRAIKISGENLLRVISRKCEL